MKRHVWRILWNLALLAVTLGAIFYFFMSSSLAPLAFDTADLQRFFADMDQHVAQKIYWQTQGFCYETARPLVFVGIAWIITAMANIVLAVRDLRREKKNSPEVAPVV